MKTKGYQISWWLIFLEFILILTISLVSAHILKWTSISKNTLEILSSLLTLLPIIIGTIILKASYPHEKIKDSLGFSGFDITMLLFFIIMPLSAQYFASIITMPATFILSQFFGEYVPAVSAPENICDFFKILVTACIIAPVLEELLFRGILMKLLSPYGFLTSAIVSSLGFSMLHLSPSGFFVILFLGFILATIRYISGSVIACMVFHAFSNFFSVMALVFEEPVLALENELIIFSIALGLCFPILFLLYKKIYPKAQTYVVTAKKQGFSIAFLMCIMIFTAYCVLLSINKI